MNNGKPELLVPGRHFLLSPFNELMNVYNMDESLIQCGPITIARVCQGQIGIGMNGAKVELLQPGLHVRNDGQYRFIGSFSLLDEVFVLK